MNDVFSIKEFAFPKDFLFGSAVSLYRPFRALVFPVPKWSALKIANDFS